MKRKRLPLFTAAAAANNFTSEQENASPLQRMNHEHQQQKRRRLPPLQHDDYINNSHLPHQHHSTMMASWQNHLMSCPSFSQDPSSRLNYIFHLLLQQQKIPEASCISLLQYCVSQYLVQYGALQMYLSRHMELLDNVVLVLLLVRRRLLPMSVLLSLRQLPQNRRTDADDGVSSRLEAEGQHQHQQQQEASSQQASSTRVMTPLNRIIRALCAIKPEPDLLECAEEYSALLSLLPLDQSLRECHSLATRNGTKDAVLPFDSIAFLPVVHSHLLKLHAPMDSSSSSHDGDIYAKDMSWFLSAHPQDAKLVLQEASGNFSSAASDFSSSLCKLYFQHVDPKHFAVLLCDSLDSLKTDWKNMCTILYALKTSTDETVLSPSKHSEIMEILQSSVDSLQEKYTNESLTSQLYALVLFKRSLLTDSQYYHWVKDLFSTSNDKNLRSILRVFQSLVSTDSIHYIKTHRNVVPRQNTQRYNKFFKKYIDSLIARIKKEKSNGSVVNTAAPISLVSNEKDITSELRKFQKNNEDYVRNAQKDYKYNKHAFVSKFLPQLFAFHSTQDKSLIEDRNRLISILMEVKCIPKDLTDKAKQTMHGSTEPDTDVSSTPRTTDANSSTENHLPPKAATNEEEQFLSRIDKNSADENISLLQELLSESLQHIENQTASSAALFRKLTLLSQHCNISVDRVRHAELLGFLVSTYTQALQSNKNRFELLSPISPWCLSFVKSTFLYLNQMQTSLQQFLSHCLSVSYAPDDSKQLRIAYCLCHLIVTFIYLEQDFHQILDKSFDIISFCPTASTKSFMRSVNAIAYLIIQHDVPLENVPILLFQYVKWIQKRTSFSLTDSFSDAIQHELKRWNAVLQKKVQLSSLFEKYGLLPMKKWIQLELSLHHHPTLNRLNSQNLQCSQIESYIGFMLSYYHQATYASETSEFLRSVIDSFCFTVPLRGEQQNDTHMISVFDSQFASYIRLQLHALKGNDSLEYGEHDAVGTIRESCFSPFFSLIQEKSRVLLEGHHSSHLPIALQRAFSIVDDSTVRLSSYLTSSLVEKLLAPGMYKSTKRLSQESLLAPLTQDINSIYSSKAAWPASFTRFVLQNMHFLLLKIDVSEEVDQHPITADILLNSCPMLALHVLRDWEKQVLFLECISNDKLSCDASLFEIFSSMHDCLRQIFAVELSEDAIRTFKNMLRSYPAAFGLVCVQCALYLLNDETSEAFHAIHSSLCSQLNSLYRTEFVQSRMMLLLSHCMNSKGNGKEDAEKLFQLYVFYASFYWSLPFLVPEVGDFSSFSVSRNSTACTTQQQQLLNQLQVQLLSFQPDFLLLIHNDISQVPLPWNELVELIFSFSKQNHQSPFTDYLCRKLNPSDSQRKNMDMGQVINQQLELKPHLIYWTKKHKANYGATSASSYMSDKSHRSTGVVEDVSLVLLHFSHLVHKVSAQQGKQEWEGKMSRTAMGAYHEMLQAAEQ